MKFSDIQRDQYDLVCVIRSDKALTFNTRIIGHMLKKMPPIEGDNHLWEVISENVKVGEAIYDRRGKKIGVRIY